MNVFDKGFVLSKHVIDQYKERVRNDLPDDEIESEIEKMINHGVELFRNYDHIYIRYGEFVFPCVKMDCSNNVYKVKTILTWKMVAKIIQLCK